MANSYTTVVLTTDTPIVPNLTGTDARDKAVNLKSIIEALASGLRNGTFDLMADGVRASGTVTLTYSKLVADETLAIGGVTLTIKNSGANGTTQWNKTTDATVTATNLAACINANTTLSKYLVATSALGVVTITCKQAGTIGNAITLVVTAADPTGYALSAATLTSGTNGTLTTNAFGM
jgi:phage tail sheath gpL-like